MTRASGGWSSPGVIVQIVSQIVAFAMMVVASWIMTQRDDSKAVNDRLNQHSAAIARLEAQIDFMRDTERRRPDGGTR